MHNWTDDQSGVISEDSCTRLLVEAGPGTGKTAVLCARIAALIDEQGVTPENIWVISFTRTAVAELRNRVGSYLLDKKNAFAIKIATIDSFAWSLNCGFRVDASMAGGFDENIKNVINLVKTHEGVFEYLYSLEHLFVDEAQDVVGERCQLILALISAIPDAAGVTVFCDNAQAIYGFANDSEDFLYANLPNAIVESSNDFRVRNLSKIHRTNDGTLINLNTEGRKIIFDNISSAKKLKKIREKILEFNHGRVVPISQQAPKIFSNNDFLLFRRRGEALAAIKKLGEQSIRVRMTEFPNVIKPWIARIFWDWISPKMSSEDFFKLWSDRNSGAVLENASDEWRTLVNFFGKSEYEIDVIRMNARISSRSPPVEFCDEYMGKSGPLVSTIHAAKGRESDSVYLYLPAPTINKNNGSTKKFDPTLEEAKVLFVGASRAKNRLYVSTAEYNNVFNLSINKRAYQEIGERLTSINIEVGRNQDVNAEGLVGVDYYDGFQDAEKAQAAISVFDYSNTCVDATLGRRGRFGVCATIASDKAVCYLGEGINWSLKEFLKDRHLRSHGSVLSGIRVLGTRTLALSEKDRAKTKLHEPWNSSGFILAPILVGFPTVSVTSKIASF